MADDDALQTAERLAEEEGLTLVRSGSNSTGFRWVSLDGRDGRTTPYRARPHELGRDLDLGFYSSAAEAALAIARHLGPDASRDYAAGLVKPARPHRKPAPARQFGVSRKQEGSSSPAVPAMAVAVVSHDDEEEDDDLVEASAVVEVLPATEVGAKRKRPVAAAAECRPATKMVSQHALQPEDAVVLCVLPPIPGETHRHVARR